MGGSYLVMNIASRVAGDITLLQIGYNYISRKVLVVIATEGSVIIDLGDPYLPRFPGIYYNFSIRPVVYTLVLGI